MVHRRSLLGCCALALSGCVTWSSSDQTTPSSPPLTGRAKGWTTARGTPAGTGRTTTTLSESYEIEWLWEYDPTLSAPTGTWLRQTPTPGVVATEDTVVATAADLEHPPVAVGRTEPSLRWHLDELIELRPQEFYRTPTPVAAGEDFFVHTANQYCRIAGDELVWSQNSGLWAQQTLFGDRSELYLSGSVTRIDPQDGEMRSAERARNAGSNRRLAVGSDVAVQTLRFDSDGEGLVVGYGPDWTVDWERPLEAPPTRAPVAVHSERAFVLTEHGTIAVGADNGVVDWRSGDYNERMGVGLDENGTAFVPHETDILVARDTSDGTVLWTATDERSLRELVGEPSHGYAPVVTDDTVVLAGRDGIAAVDRAAGSVRWHADLSLVGAPAVAFGDVYAITTNGIAALRGL